MAETSKRTLIIVAVVPIIIVILLYLILTKKLPISVSSPSSPSSPSSSPSSSPTYSLSASVQYYYNGQSNTIYLPSQSGTAINVTQGTPINIIGTAQPQQSVSASIYAPDGSLVYYTSVTAFPNGDFLLILPTLPLSTNVQYKITLSLGSNYYVYATVVSPPPTSSLSAWVTYIYNNQQIAVHLPSGSGAAIYVPKGEGITISGAAQPQQSVSATMYAPDGSVVYSTSITVESNGFFLLSIPTSSLSTNVQYKITLSLGSNYYVYATIVPPPPPLPPYSASVSVQYYYNGQSNTIYLPSQSGTAINVTQGTPINIIGTAQPLQVVNAAIYLNGSLAYIAIVTADSNGHFDISIPTSSLSTNLQYKIALSLGSNYYFYATVVSS